MLHARDETEVITEDVVLGQLLAALLWAAWSMLLSHGGESPWMTSHERHGSGAGFLQPLSYLDENIFHSCHKGKLLTHLRLRFDDGEMGVNSLFPLDFLP